MPPRATSGGSAQDRTVPSSRCCPGRRGAKPVRSPAENGRRSHGGRVRGHAGPDHCRLPGGAEIWAATSWPPPATPAGRA